MNRGRGRRLWAAVSASLLASAAVASEPVHIEFWNRVRRCRRLLRSHFLVASDWTPMYYQFVEIDKSLSEIGIASYTRDG
jgi:hypothetical protein